MWSPVVLNRRIACRVLATDSSAGLSTTLEHEAQKSSSQRASRGKVFTMPHVRQACIPIHHLFEINSFPKHCRAAVSDQPFVQVGLLDSRGPRDLR